MKRILLIAICLILFSLAGTAQSMISAKDAAKHLGKKVTICDKVFSEDIKPFVVVLFLGADRPNHSLSVVIKADTKTKFKGHYKNNGHFEDHYTGKDICVTGLLEKGGDGKTVIRVTDPSQIKPFFVDNPVKGKSALN